MSNESVIAEYKAAFEGLQNKFKSGNSVSVERISVGRQELTRAFRYWLYRLCGGDTHEASEKEFEEWLADPATHWMNDKDAAWQAWQEQQEKIDVLRARVAELEDSCKTKS